MEQLTEDRVREISREAVTTWAKGAAVGFLVLAVGIASGWKISGDYNESARQAVVDSGRAVAVVGCNRDYQLTTELRQIINNSKQNIRLLGEEGTLTQAQVGRLVKNQNDALKSLPVPDCRRAADELTQHPNEDVRAPKPLHPPDK